MRQRPVGKTAFRNLPCEENMFTRPLWPLPSPPVQMLNIHSFLETERLYSFCVTYVDSLGRRLAMHLRLSVSIKIFSTPCSFYPKILKQKRGRLERHERDEVFCAVAKDCSYNR